MHAESLVHTDNKERVSSALSKCALRFLLVCVTQPAGALSIGMFLHLRFSRFVTCCLVAV